MSQKSKKILFSIVGSILAISIIVATVIYVKYINSSRNSIDITLNQFTLTPSKNIKLGDVITASLDINLPWGYYPENVELSTVDGIQIVNEATITECENRWGKALWKVNIEIQPYRTGKIKKQNCSIKFIFGKNSNEVKTAKTTIPPFFVLAVDTAKRKNLDLAGNVVIPPIDRSATWWAISIAVLAFAGVVIFIIIWVIKRKKEMGPPIVLPWTLAASLLNSLRHELQNHKINNRVCLTRLTDIVRNYLEKRYSISVNAQTTNEFLSDLDKTNSPLPVEHRNFLRDFMAASDLVKFANIPADSNLLNNAMSKADELVKSTIPEEDEHKEINI